MSKNQSVENCNLVVYGVNCTWWDFIKNAGFHEMPDGHKLPCCPNCGSVLYQMPSRDWWKSVSEYKGYADYPNLIRWMRGKCFEKMSDAIYAYEHRRRGE